MLIQYTPEEAKHLEEMRLEYSARLIDAKDEKEKRMLLIQFQNARDKYTEACELKRFKKLGKNLDAILEDAKAQVLALIEAEYNSLVSYSTSEELKQLGIGTEKEGRFYLSAGFISSLIIDELKLHMKALQDDAERLQILLAYIVETVENSDYTDNAEINLADIEDTQTDDNSANLKPQALGIYRRQPLANIEKIGIMSDKLNTKMLTDPNGMLEGLLTEEANGQLRLFWSVNEAGKRKEQVAVMASLSLPPGYEGLSRKLSGYDLAVYSAVSDIFEKWIIDHPHEDLNFSPADVWRRMNGKQPNDKQASPGEPKTKKIVASIDKMLMMRFSINLKEELEKHLITLEDSRLIDGELTDYFLNCAKANFLNEKGVRISGYSIPASRMPILYKYNKAKGYIRNVPFELLDISEQKSDSEYMTEFKFFLLRQIQMMQSKSEEALSDKKNKPRINPDNKILLETIYRGAGVPTPEERAIEWAKSGRTSAKGEAELKKAIDVQTRKNRIKDKEKIENILTSWTGKKWIKGFTAISGKNKTVTGYSIKL